MSGSLPPLYAMSVLGVGVYWLVQVSGMARQRSWPRLGFLMPLGLAALLGAPETALDVPALFGMGLGFALIAAYVPLPTLRPGPSQAGWMVTGLCLLLGLLALGLAGQQQSFYWLMAAVALILAGAALLVWQAYYPRRTSQARVPVPPRQDGQRWQAALTPDIPDLELSLEAHQARILNTSPYALKVLGWSPARHNAWFPLREQGGQPSPYLNSGQTGYLMDWEPLSAGNGGVRLWYTHAGQDEVYLFRADWESGTQAGVQDRVLN